MKKGRKKMISISVAFVAPGKDERRKVRLNEWISVRSFVDKPQTSEVSCRKGIFQ